MKRQEAMKEIEDREFYVEDRWVMDSEGVESMVSDIFDAHVIEVMELNEEIERLRDI